MTTRPSSPALGAHWQQQGRFHPPASFPKVEMRGPLLIVSGSCSPTTDRQIERALGEGFTEVPLDAARLPRATAELIRKPE
ncbi:MAG: hypothetical protein ACREIA_27325 [Opitutaceae bacterium]